ncbi:MAG TPA: HAD-IA family hydrolase [Terriglobales bacterium]|nr:HAD-IA family hydrolase [Terriglobales bacterium]
MTSREFHCAAILFDLDGVLVDSTRSVARLWKLWAKENKLDPAQLLEIAHGRRTIEVVRLLTPHLPAEAEVEKIEAREAADTHGVSVMPGAVELVASIPQRRWAVVTSGTRYLATARLRLAKIALPEVLISADDVVNGKPHPEPYLKGAQRLGFRPEECLVIEDAPAGIAAAHAGGMKVIALASTYPAGELREADAVIGKLAQLQVTLSDSSSARGALQVIARSS